MNEETTGETITSEIIQFEDRLMGAIRNCDIDHLDFLIHDDLLFIGPDGVPITKMIDLEKYRSEAIKIFDLNISNRTISVHGDTAVVVVHVSQAGTHDDIPFDGNYQYLRVWKIFGDSWQIIAGSCTKL